MQNGYTLIEILVAITIFFVIIAGPTSFFISSIRGQIRSLASREIIDNSSYILEYISRSLRMAKKDLTGDCISTGSNYENPESSDISKIRFLNYNSLCQEFSLVSGQLKERKSTNASSTNFGDYSALTSSDLEITLLKFQLSGQTQEDDFQPKITLLYEITRINQPEFPRIKFQTTISQRNLDLLY